MPHISVIAREMTHYSTKKQVHRLTVAFQVTMMPVLLHFIFRNKHSKEIKFEEKESDIPSYYAADNHPIIHVNCQWSIGC